MSLRPGGRHGDRAAVAKHIARGVALFNQGRYWEAHEALEAVWREAVPPERDLWQGLIQAAAAMLHRERGNRHGLLTQGAAAIQKLRRAAPAGFPVETARFVQELQRCVEEGGPVPPMLLQASPTAGRGKGRAKGS
jgi:predicted metal-dependent hydrolase